jgi:hypothetical protein
VFNPTETTKNGPAKMSASTPALRSVAPSTAASAVLPATAQSYGDARGIVNGDHRRWFGGAVRVDSEAACAVRDAAIVPWMRSTLAKHSGRHATSWKVFLTGGADRGTTSADSGSLAIPGGSPTAEIDNYQVQPNRLRVASVACQRF